MKFRLLIVGLALSTSLFAQNADTAFLTARDAFRAGNINKLERAASQLGNHELAPYAESYRLRMWMDKGDPSELRDFLQLHEGSYVAEKLRADWIRWFARRSTWNEVDAEFPKLLAPEADIVCLSQQARLARDDRSVLGEAEKRWLTMLEPPESCRPILDALVASQRLGVDDVWTRARRQLEANRPNWTKTTLNYLPDSQMPEGRALDSALNSAMRHLVRQPSHWSNSRAGRELATFAIQRLATNDPHIAADELEKIGDKLQVSERQWAWSQIALQAAKKHLTEAIGWYANAGSTPLSDEGAQWKVRAALRAQEWGVVHDTIQAMPPTLAERPEWTYWLGRALKAGGRTTGADAPFGKIARETNF